MVIRCCSSLVNQRRLMISILLVGFRTRPWHLSQMWRFGAEVQPGVILSESEKYYFVGAFLVGFFCCCCSFLPSPSALHWMFIPSSYYTFVPLSPSLHMYSPSYFLFYFHFSSILGLTFLCFTCLTSSFCVVWVASPLTCLHHYSRSIEKE